MKRIAVLFGVLACSSAPSSAAFAAVGTVTSAACNVEFDAFAAPAPLVRGSSSIKLVATDLATGLPKAGLAMNIVPFMPAMGHGSSTDPTVVEQGDGVYVASDVVMAMPGNWQLRTTITGACSDAIVLDVDVQ